MSMEEHLIGRLIKLVRLRISDDNPSNIICSDNQISQALDLSISAFNQVPPFTQWVWGDDELLEPYSDLFVTYAAYILLLRQSLKERGREFAIKDQGVDFVPPPLSDFLAQSSTTLFYQWIELAKLSKKNE